MNKVPARATTTEQLSLIYPSDTDSARRKRIRTEGFGIKFEKTSDSPEAQRCAVGWAFDVPVEFREQLDILYSVLADKKANEALKKKLGVKKLDPNQRKYRNAWTRGVPPALSFSAGHIFYDPPGIRSLEWGIALPKLRRVVQIKEATPDGAAAPDEIIESPGWVRFEISRYKRGKLSSREEHTLSQAEFAFLLQHGNLPPDIES